jgi:hypothetical protein
MSHDQEALIDIVEAIKLILQYVEAVDFDALVANIEKQDAILRRIMITAFTSNDWYVRSQMITKLLVGGHCLPYSPLYLLSEVRAVSAKLPSDFPKTSEHSTQPFLGKKFLVCVMSSPIITMKSISMRYGQSFKVMM